MSAIEASSGTYRSRVDGTIVLSVEIEPRYRAAALELFGMPGTPLALAALRVARSTPKSDGGVGYYCLRAIKLSQDPKFWEWVKFASMSANEPTTAGEASEFIKRICKVESRTEFDTDVEARTRFLGNLETPFFAWLKP